MTQRQEYIFQTNNFYRTWTWVKRGFVSVVFDSTLLLWGIENDQAWLISVLMILITTYILAQPKDDIAYNKEQLVYLERSIIPWFTRVKTYPIEEITSIRVAGIHSDRWELVDFFNGGGSMGGYYNLIELSFKDLSSDSIRLAVARKDLDRLVKWFYTLKRERT